MKIHKKSVHQDIEQKYDQRNFKTLKFETMRYHIKAKHSETKISSSECDYLHPVSSKVKSHHRQVHLGIKRTYNRGKIFVVAKIAKVLETAHARTQIILCCIVTNVNIQRQSRNT